MSGWRARWAERESQRRGQAYATAIDAWQRRDADLRARLQAALQFAGSPVSGPLPVQLRRGEQIYLTLADVQSVEAPNTAALPPASWADSSAGAAGPLPFGIRVRDHGTAVLTSGRLLFLGSAGNREWAYGKLTGLLHDPIAPMTLLRVSNRKMTSGMVVPPAASAGFRFTLQLAMADAAGQRSGFIAHLDQLIRDHQRLRPMPPIAALPADAPASAAWSPPRILAAGAAVLILVICVIGALAPSPKTQPANRSDPALAVSTTRPVPAANPRLTVGTARPATAKPHLTVSTTRPVPAITAAQKSTVSSPKPPTTHKPKPSPRPQPVDLCGAPANPFGYTFCAGSLIRSPDASVCDYFACIGNFWNGVGYMEQCTDGMVSMSGGRQGSCSHHGGNRRPVYQR